MGIFDDWLQPSPAPTGADNVTILEERVGGRDAFRTVLPQLLREHYVGIDVLERMGFHVAAEHLRSKVPTKPRSMSGDLGELLATEYIVERLGYEVPVKRLRYKDDRNTALRGDDVIGVRRLRGQPQVLKAEAKSRLRLDNTVVAGAIEALQQNSHRPNRSTLGMLIQILYERREEEKARILEELLTKPVDENNLEHLLFTLSGNDPGRLLIRHASGVVRRTLVGVTVADHADFIREAYSVLDGS